MSPTSHIVIGTAGHIDHGKSALVQALTGIDPDRLKEEKARGITIELGFAHAEIDGITAAFVDVPGHERFVRTMLAGVGGIDVVMLVVAADESVMPQTREHFDICRLLRLERGLVVLTKTDLVDAETIELVRLEVKDLVAGTFLERAPVVPVSARTGEGLEALRQAMAAIARAVPGRPADGAARLPIDRAFSMQGFGTVVTGTLVAGRIAAEDELELVPGGRKVRVRGIQVHGRRQPRAAAGQRTAINLGGIEVGDIARGQTLAAPGALTIARRVDASLDLLPGAKRLKHGARVRFHHGTSEVLGRISVPGPGVGAIEPGEHAFVRVRLEAPAALTRGDRFILRAYSPPMTIAGGEVLDPDPPRAGVRTAAAGQRLAALVGGQDDRQALARMVADAGARGLPVARLVSRGGVRPVQVRETVTALETSGAVIVAGDRLVAPSVVETLTARLLALVGEFHAAQPLVEGIPREEARERVFTRAHPHVFDRVLAALAGAGRLVVRDRLALPTHRVELSGDDARVRAAVERAYREAGLTPPDAATLAAAAGAAPAAVERVTALLVRQKVLARVDALIFHSDALGALKTGVQALKAAAPGGRATVDVTTFKSRYGVTRKFAIPLLEWLDRERVTRRMGDTRIVL